MNIFQQTLRVEEVASAPLGERHIGTAALDNRAVRSPVDSEPVGGRREERVGQWVVPERPLWRAALREDLRREPAAARAARGDVLVVEADQPVARHAAHPLGRAPRPPKVVAARRNLRPEARGLPVGSLVDVLHLRRERLAVGV
eukprot:CAMPEP_0202761778 /NCGR_PEP_ID=MMETSP1388-20130828/20482_1 /ASSEMBLY_ACC=CAM_ASM_000864 /TAXON_ID=37098 /ORGANISM="Isochrysis sp, Strain CCMP1244" /LENGTH=143 /DNA_ID=CAMNT_0049429945 /DNA_START=66 /DNA_END=497 /DNA_ORIENTATION=-